MASCRVRVGHVVKSIRETLTLILYKKATLGGF